MKKMMKEVTGKIESYTSKKHEMHILQSQIIKEMNNMEVFYRENKYNDNKPKPHLEKEVITLYNANKIRIERAGIGTSNLKPFIKNSEREQHEQKTRHINEYKRTQQHHTKDSTSQNDKKVSGNPSGSIPVTQNDPVLDRNGRDSPDSEEDFDVQNHYYNANGTHSQYEYCI